MSVGIKNNNYLNLKNGSTPWQDAGHAPSGTDNKGHAVFKNPAYGVRAGILLLRTYFIKHKLQTIAKILARWAPEDGTVGDIDGGPLNSPTEYSEFVSARMRIGPNAKLQLFDADGSIEELGQVRDLFFAMAAYEIGKIEGKYFKVPEQHFIAGVELLEPGISKSGTESTDISGVLTVPAGLVPDLSGSVGPWNKDATNVITDVETVQHLLKQAALALKNPALDPGETDGKIASNSKDSTTVEAIIAFQRRYFTKPDGLIEPNGRTWRELLSLVQANSDVPITTPIEANLASIPSQIPSTGFCLHLRRLRRERRNNVTYDRTIGEYRCFWNGAALSGLSGNMVERGGSGDNSTSIGDAQDRCVEAKSYPLKIQDGEKYRTFHYDRQDVGPTGRPKPGILLGKTGERVAILIHPGSGYLSSVGCLNPSSELKNANADINFSDSRRRVIAIIDALQQLLGSEFPKDGRIPNAIILIEE